MGDRPTIENSDSSPERLKVREKLRRDFPDELYLAKKEAGGQRELRDPTGLALLVGLVLVVCVLTVGCVIVYIIWLKDATPSYRIDHLGQILVPLVGAVMGAISTLMLYFYRRGK